MACGFCSEMRRVVSWIVYMPTASWRRPPAARRQERANYRPAAAKPAKTPSETPRGGAPR